MTPPQGIEVKGKGVMMTYIYAPREECNAVSPMGHTTRSQPTLSLTPGPEGVNKTSVNDPLRNPLGMSGVSVGLTGAVE